MIGSGDDRTKADERYKNILIKQLLMSGNAMSPDENGIVMTIHSEGQTEKDKMRAFNDNLKRIFDCAASCGGMIVFSPLIAAIYIAIKCDSKGPAIFKQERIGRGGKPFTLYKFRSMEVTSESDGKPALCRHDDARLTKVGKFIREHHLDELPQLWNVAKGDMSFVGPRPERQYYIDKIMEVNPDYEKLYALRPGLFSYATLHNGYTDTLEKMLKRLDYDLEYLETRTLSMDTKIIFQTVWSILSGKKF